MACSDPAAPGSVLEVRIVGPSVVEPGDSATLYGIANHSRLGALAPAGFTWTVDTVTVSGRATVRVAPGLPPVPVRLRVRASDGAAGEATFSVWQAAPDTLLWEVDLQAPVHPLGIRFSPADGRLFVLDFDGATGLVLHAGREPAASRRPRVEWDVYAGDRLLAAFPDGDVLLQAAGGDQVVRRVAPDGAVRWEYDPIGGSYARVALTRQDGLIYLHSSTFGMGALTPAGTQSWERQGTFYTGALTDDADRWVAWGYANPSILIDIGRTDTGWQASSVAGPPACPWVRGAVFGGGDVLYVITAAGSSSLTPANCLSRAIVGADGVATTDWTVTLDFDMTIDQVAVGRDGAVFFGRADGSVVSLGPDGAERWRSGPTTAACTGAGSAPALGADGTVFHHAHGRLIALAPDGTVRWTHAVADPTGRPCRIFAPVLTDDGRLFVASWGYRVRAYRAATAADPEAVWGQDGGDARRSRQARTGG